jgi:hypothetical protein
MIMDVFIADDGGAGGVFADAVVIAELHGGTCVEFCHSHDCVWILLSILSLNNRLFSFRFLKADIVEEPIVL